MFLLKYRIIITEKGEVNLMQVFSGFVCCDGEPLSFETELKGLWFNSYAVHGFLCRSSCPPYKISGPWELQLGRRF